LNAEQRRYVETAQDQLRRVSEIAAHTLTFNRQRNMKGEASMSEILDSVLTLYEDRLASSQVGIERRFQHTLPITCYPGELRQAFANLIGNAFDATRNGGRIILRERAVAHHPKTRDRGIRITLADTGHGMDADVKAHLFDPFHTTKGINGTGLGLWISKGIIDKHHGSIRLRSSARKGCSGTVVSIFLPLNLANADAEHSSFKPFVVRRMA
jgi:signal transduction histidine kinase